MRSTSSLLNFTPRHLSEPNRLKNLVDRIQNRGLLIKQGADPDGIWFDTDQQFSGYNTDW
jgi:hypothetical protein